MWAALEEENRRTLAELPFGAWDRRELRLAFLSYLKPRGHSRMVRMSEEFQDWYLDNRESLAVRIPFLDAAIKEQDASKQGRRPLSVRPVPAEMVDRSPVPPKSKFQRRLDWVAETLRLSDDDARMFGLVVRLARMPRFRDFYTSTGDNLSGYGEVDGSVVGRILGVQAESLAKAVALGPLGHLGLVEDIEDGDFQPSRLVMRILSLDTTSPKALASALLGKPEAADLSMADFRHLGESGRFARDLLAGAVSNAEKGVGILFHGPVGTGKSEFARALGKEVGARVVFVGEVGEDTWEPTRADRLAHLAFVGALADRAGKIVVVVDEAEDIFAGIDAAKANERTGSKAFMNRMVDQCPVPAIWITNFPKALGQSVVRRMSHAVEFREPDARVRRTIVDRHVGKLGLGMDDEDRKALAAISAPPAVIRAGLRAARIAGGSGAAAVGAARALLRALGRDDAPEDKRGNLEFDPFLSSADVDVPLFERRIAAVGDAGQSFLLHGIPGAGKSAFAYRIATLFEMDVLERKASDLLGAYVGESEQRIRDAFAEAADTRKFLVFNEADSLLANRQQATQRHEVGQVNEMLTWMDRHPRPFAATTNFLTNLDAAAIERFDFQVKFVAMNAAQVAEAFRRSFGMEAPASVLRLDPLTPRDFARASRQARVFGSSTAAEFAELLAKIVAAKPHASRPIGFGA